jgi:hypothetical protein
MRHAEEPVSSFIIMTVLSLSFDTIERFLNGDLNGTFTFLNENGSSVIDYFLSSVECVVNCISLHVGNRVESFHMPVVLKLDVVAQDISTNKGKRIDKIKWDDNKAEMFLDFLNLQDTREYC